METLASVKSGQEQEWPTRTPGWGQALLARRSLPQYSSWAGLAGPAPAILDTTSLNARLPQGPSSPKGQVQDSLPSQDDKAFPFDLQTVCRL